MSQAAADKAYASAKVFQQVKDTGTFSAQQDKLASWGRHRDYNQQQTRASESGWVLPLKKMTEWSQWLKTVADDLSNR